MSNASREASKMMAEAIVAHTAEQTTKTTSKKPNVLNDEKHRKEIKKMRKKARRMLKGS